MIAGPVRGVLEGEAPYSGKVYFFQGAQYWRYDLKKDYGEVDYPKPLSAWKLPREFDSGVDACLSGQGLFKGNAYFFKDQWYVSYNWKSNLVSERRLIAQWDRARAFPFANGIDAALNGQKPHEGKAYFFKGEKYARYDWNEDRIDLVDQKLSAWRLGDGFDSHITACLRGDEGGWGKNPTAYFFKGDSYVKYDWTDDRAVKGYPLPIGAGWPTGCAVWASHSQAPTNVCPDPRLDVGKRLVYPSGTLSGQAGWQILVEFVTVNDLANKLSGLTIPAWYGDDQAGNGHVPPGRITRLGINAHGLVGAFGINGPNAMSEFSQFLTDNVILGNEKVGADLERIRRMLAPGASVLLLGCQAAQSIVGGQLVMSLSKVLKDHPVTAFTSIGYAGGPDSQRSDQGCSEAGMRDTNYYIHSNSPQEENDRVAKNWWDLKAWPWASEVSPRAKTALNDVIIRRPEGDMPPFGK
jgi:hypothetical protein